MMNDEIESDNEEYEQSDAQREVEIDETAAEKKLRLAKEYINLIKEREGDVNEAIRDEELEAQGKLFKPCAEQVGKHFSENDFETRICKNGHSKTVTGCVYHPNGKSAFSCGKDGSVIRWSIESLKNMRRTKTRPGLRKSVTDGVGHKTAVLALAINSAGTHVATGDDSGRIIVWSDSLG